MFWVVIIGNEHEFEDSMREEQMFFGVLRENFL